MEVSNGLQMRTLGIPFHSKQMLACDVMLTHMYTTWPKDLESYFFYSYSQACQHIITCVDACIERYVKYNKIAKFLNFHFYERVKLIKYIMSHSLLYKRPHSKI